MREDTVPVPGEASLPSELAWPGFLQLPAPLYGNLLQANSMVAGPAGRKLHPQGKELGVREVRAWVIAAWHETWCGRQEERGKAQRAHWLAPPRRPASTQQVQVNRLTLVADQAVWG